ncbi:PAS domain S-box protein [Desulfobacterales bacterium HSG17]|nr:PAS domain S-box protein [Desulfobacterales bacterium HSG17]
MSEKPDDKELEKRIQRLEQAEFKSKTVEEQIKKKNEQLIANQCELSKSEALFRGLFDNMTSGSAIYEVINDGSKGTDYIVKGFNNKSLELERKTLDQVIGKNLFDLRPSIDDFGLIPVLKKVWETGISAYFPVKIYQDKNFSNYYENYIFKIPSGEIVTIYNDVTDQKNAEMELKASKERFELAMRFANDGLFDWNLETNDIYFSPAWKKMLGYNDNEILNDFSEWERLTAPQDIKESWVMLNEVLEGKRDRFEKEFKMQHKDGHWVDILSRANIVSDEKGKPVRLLGTHVDITERKQAENELQRLRNLLSNIINSMPSVLVGVDRDGVITQWNRQAENVTGIKAENALGQLLEETFPQLAPEMEKVHSAIETLETQKDLRVESIFNNKPLFTDVIVYPLISNGAEGAVIRVDDVTERVNLEEMMIQSEKMLSVGGLAAGMAHEINNPLAGILQNTQVMRNRISGELQKNKLVAQECNLTIEGIEEYMNKRGILKMMNSIEESGKRAAKIVENMLLFSRKSESSFALYNLGELLDKTIELAENDYDLKKKYDFRQIQIVREYDSFVPEVPCEATKIQQVFLNILKNGAQAMSENKEEGKVPCFILRLKSKENMVCIEIEDNGAGMNESVRRRIFEPFFTTKEVGIGTGIGLSVSYFIITKNHNGTMSVESIPGCGTKFIIHLPIL